MGLEMKHLREGGAEWRGHEKPIYTGKRGAWTVCRFKGDLARKRVVVFLRGS